MPADRGPGGMTVVNGIDALESAHGPLFIVVGVFDGLHLGHQYLLEHLVSGASARAARPTVITFDSHPDEVLTGKAPPLLLDPAERLERLEVAGVEVTVVQHFDVDLRMTPYDQFIDRIAARTWIAGFLMTPDAAFGHDRGGTVATVSALGKERGFDVAVVPPFELDGSPVRSSDIRAAIATGDLRTARSLLGRDPAVVGRIAADPPLSRLVPDMPFALPPDGEYTFHAWRVDTEDDRSWVHLATVDGKEVVLPGERFAPNARVRLSFP